jgi:tetraacyldisaccharide-1-P 4'-kinase
LEHAASNCGADALLCTEKDVWNLRGVQINALPVYCCRISFDLPASFWDAMNDAARRVKIDVSR